MLDGMLFTLPAEGRDLLSVQCGIITRRQAMSCRIDGMVIDNQLRSGRWQRLHQGVYATFTGPLPRAAQLNAALLRAGPGAALSYHSAAEVFGLTADQNALIHVTVPLASRPGAIPGLMIHRSSRIEVARHPALTPPRTRIEETTLDLISVASDFDAAFGWLCRATGQRMTTTARLRSAVLARTRMRWRQDILAALAEIGGGVHSNLERRYVLDVEHAHQLPAARRQAPMRRGSRSQYLDNLYEDQRVAVELDGRAAHPVHARWADIYRDNFFARYGIITLRYNWSDITGRPCQVAAEISEILRQQGWPGSAQPCGPACLLLPPTPPPGRAGP